jgi:UDP-N-acetyl-D-glucosamine dehydrogenase
MSERAVNGRDEVVGIVGLGYVGLPLAVSFTESGLEVLGLEANAGRVAQLQAGSSPINDVSDERLQAALAGGLRIELADPALVRTCDVVFVCVPTPIDRAKNPDLGPMRQAGAMIAKGLKAGQLIVLQSTTFPGTTAGPFRIELEHSGLAAGKDFDLAFAPERINPGDPRSATRTVPRLVGGTTPEATKRAQWLLERISDRVIAMSSPDAAEMAKLLENIFRNVNIALVNQLALLCERMGVDVWEVIDGAATKPFGFMRFTPGPGVGGHCIPVDPYYLASRAREFDFVDRFVETAGDVNLTMPRHVVDLCVTALNDRSKALQGSRIGLIGVAFKPNVSDARNSPAASILAQLAERGAEAIYHDPHVQRFEDETKRVYESVPLDALVSSVDLVLIVTAHRDIDWELVFDRSPLILDTVNQSHGRDVRDRQLLRLGAGWGTQAEATERSKSEAPATT